MTPTRTIDVRLPLVTGILEAPESYPEFPDQFREIAFPEGGLDWPELAADEWIFCVVDSHEYPHQLISVSWDYRAEFHRRVVNFGGSIKWYIGPPKLTLVSNSQET